MCGNEILYLLNVISENFVCRTMSVKGTSKNVAVESRNFRVSASRLLKYRPDKAAEAGHPTLS